MNANPFLIKGPAQISVSGGRTSMRMLKGIIDAHGGRLPEDVHADFANTGKEDTRTLDFVQECSERWNVPITWVEFDPEAEHMTRVVNHNSASRDGEPLRHAIDTRPTQHLFNRVSRYCTATTKLRRLQKLMHHWRGYDRWTVVLGIRHDEPRRVKSNRARSGRDRQDVALPLDDAKIINDDILSWWEDQPFQLQLPIVDGETIGGNCDDCPLKGEWKILVHLRRSPEAADWWIAREDEMRERVKNIPFTGDGPDLRAFFRKDKNGNGVSYRTLLEKAQSDQPILKGRGRESVDCACTD